MRDRLKPYKTHISLTKKGGNYFGECPLCADPDCIIIVKTRTGMFQTYKCKQGGDDIDFLKKLPPLL